MDKIIDFITTFFSNSNNISLVNIFVTVFISYHIAIFTSGRPIKLQVKDLQLNHVYSPLYQILKEVSCSLPYDEAVKLHNKISEILTNNYELAFPELHRLNASFGIHLSNHTNYSRTLDMIVHQVSIDHSLLRKSLGYPCENTLTLFIRMTVWQKVEFLLGHLNIIGILLFVACCTYFSSTQSSATHTIFLRKLSYFYISLFAVNICFIIHKSRIRHSREY